MTVKNLLAARNGVTLKKVELHNGSAVVATAYHLATRRTPQIWNFDNEAEAWKMFEQEAAACG